MTSPMKHNVLNVKFKDGASDKDVKQALKEIRALKGVFNAKALFPGDKDRTLKTMYTVRTDDRDIHTEDTRVAIEKIKNVQFAEYPARRKLMKG